MSIASRRTAFVEAAAIFGIALGVRAVGIGQDAGGDELYHILAAKQFLADGTLGIHGADPYTRGKPFTMLVAACMRLFGETPEAARIPSLAAGSLTVLVAFLWVRSLGERGGAWAAGLLLAFDPELVKLSQWARFYTLQHLAFLSGAVAVFSLLRAPFRTLRFVLLAGSAVLAFGLALQLQVTTEIGLAGVVLFACLATMIPLGRKVRDARHGWRIGAGVAVLAAIGALAIWRAGILGEAHQLAADVDLWAASRATNWRYYHSMFQESYPTLWTLFPLLLLVCAVRQSRLAALCASVFGTAFVAHSFVALKHERYLSYAFPFFLIPCGVALATALPWIVDRLAAIELPWRVAPEGRRRLAAVAVALAAGFALAANPAFARTARLILMDPTLRQPGMEHEGLSWRRAADALRPVASSVEVVVSTDDLPTLYYLGRLDYVISATQLALETGGAEFTLDSSTAAPLLTKPESLERLMSCYSSGLILGRAWAFETDWAVPPDTAAFVERQATRFPLPEGWGVRAFVWDNPNATRGSGCPPRGPIVYQLLHSSTALDETGKPKPNTNNLFTWHRADTDRLSEMVRKATTREDLKNAMQPLQRIIHDEAIFVPGYAVDFVRVASWRWVKWPDCENTHFSPPVTYEPHETFVYWIDDDIKKETQAARRSGKTFPESTRVFDDYREQPAGEEEASEP